MRWLLWQPIDEWRQTVPIAPRWQRGSPGSSAGTSWQLVEQKEVYFTHKPFQSLANWLHRRWYKALPMSPPRYQSSSSWLKTTSILPKFVQFAITFCWDGFKLFFWNEFDCFYVLQSVDMLQFINTVLAGISIWRLNLTDVTGACLADLVKAPMQHLKKAWWQKLPLHTDWLNFVLKEKGRKHKRIRPSIWL